MSGTLFCLVDERDYYEHPVIGIFDSLEALKASVPEITEWEEDEHTGRSPGMEVSYYRDTLNKLDRESDDRPFR